MANSTPNQELTMITELMISTLAARDALAKLLIDKGLITRQEFIGNVVLERGAYEKLFSATPQ